MNASRKQAKPRTKCGTALTEFTAGMVLFFCFLFVPAIDMSFVPVRYLLVDSYLETIVHHMALSEKRSDAISYLNTGAWKADVEKWGVKVKNAKATLVINDNTGGKTLTVEAGNPVPPNWLPNSIKKGQALVYSLELTVDADVPPLYSSDIGLPGFNKAIAFTFRHRDQWENLSANPLSTTGPNNLDYYVNQ